MSETGVEYQKVLENNILGNEKHENRNYKLCLRSSENILAFYESRNINICFVNVNTGFGFSRFYKTQYGIDTITDGIDITDGDFSNKNFQFPTAK